jgi:hypothetical protein
MRDTMKPAYDAYRVAHGGQWPDDDSQLQAYATAPEQQSALRKLMLRNSHSN